MQLRRGGVISGTVYSPEGEPLGRSFVNAWRYANVGGQKRLQQSNGQTTDDRGVFRISGLQAGDYLISATPNASESQMAARINPDAALVEQAIATGRVQPPAAPGLPSMVLVPIPPPQPPGTNGVEFPSYLPVYYPGTPVAANAQVIHVTGGDEHVADITVQYVEAGSIQGTIAGTTKLSQVRVSVVNNDSNADNFNGSGVDPNGRFVIRSLAPGTYTVMAQSIPMNAINVGRGGGPLEMPAQPASDERLWGTAAATVTGGSPTSVSISLNRGRSISGSVIFDTPRPPDFTRVRMTVSLVGVGNNLSMMFGSGPQGVIETDGRFTITGVAPGKYSLRVNAGFQATSVMVAGVDILDTPLDFQATEDITDAVITLTDKLNELSGTVTDSTGKPAIDYMVVAASPDDRYWSANSRRIALARTGADGKYTFRSLPPGEYYVVLMTDLEQGGQYDPEFLRSLPSTGTRVRVTEGGKTVQDLRVR